MKKHIDHPLGHDRYRTQVYIPLCQPDSAVNAHFCVLWEYRGVATCEACILIAFQMEAESHRCERPDCGICTDKYDVPYTRDT